MTTDATNESYAAEPAPGVPTAPAGSGEGGLRRLSRAVDDHPVAPVRLVHLGVGNFFRAHGAWYTEHAPDAAEWGIAAFTGRSPRVAESLAAQDGLYTLLVRGPAGSTPEVIGSLSAVHAADDLAALRRYFADPQVAVVTSTVTEAGYRRATGGSLDTSATDVAADIDALKRDPLGGTVTTTPGRLVAGLLARRNAGAGPIAFVPCDNVSDNGEMVARVVRDLARLADESLLGWIDDNVATVTTMVDRITPRTADDDRAEVARLAGIDDPETVPTEPFTEWVLSGEFPGGRPAWEAAGARFVEDVRPFEQRKLWMLNGSHTLMAYAASILGHETVSAAIADPEVRGWVDEWWDTAAAHLPLPAEDVADYRQALLDRYANPQIRHLLAQIAADGSQKVPIRAVPVIRAELGEGRVATGATRIVAAWVAHLRGHGAPVTDDGAGPFREAASGSVEEASAGVLAALGLTDERLIETVAAQVADLESRTAR